MKKFILPGFIILLALFILSSFPSPAFAFLGFNEGGGSSMDCYKVLENATRNSREIIEWSADKEQFFKYTSQKVLNKQDGSYCLLQRGQPKNDLFHDEQEVKITYFSSKDQALSQVGALKGQERADFTVSSSDDQSYLGITQNKGAYLPGGPPPFYEIEGETYARSVRALGNCVAEVKFLDHTERHGYTVESREAFFDLMKLFIVDPAQRLMDKYVSVNSEILAFCGAKAPTTASTSQTSQVVQTKPSQHPVAKQQTSGRDGNPFNIFGINPYQTWLNLVELVNAGALMKTGAFDRFTESTILHSVGTEPYWERDARARAAYDLFYNQATERFVKLQGKTGLTEINDPTKKTLIEAVKDSVIIKKDAATIDLQPINGQKGVLEDNGDWPMLKYGAVDVIVEPQNSKQFEMQTPNAEIMVIGTEFSVIYDQGKGETLVAVYKGKVEVKTNDGKATTITPDGGKPGVVVIAQKLSPVKFAIIGVILVIIIGGIIMIWKRKFSTKEGNKKKK